MLPRVIFGVVDNIFVVDQYLGDYFDHVDRVDSQDSFVSLLSQIILHNLVMAFAQQPQHFEASDHALHVDQRLFLDQTEILVPVLDGFADISPQLFTVSHSFVRDVEEIPQGYEELVFWVVLNNVVIEPVLDFLFLLSEDIAAESDELHAVFWVFGESDNRSAENFN